MNLLSSYLQLMQNQNNPIESGCNWSSIGYPMTNKKETKQEINYSSKQPQGQLLKLQEELGNLSQKLQQFAHNQRLVGQSNFSQKLGIPANQPNVSQILQEIVPKIDPIVFCQQYCGKKKLLLKMDLVYDKTAMYSYTMTVKQFEGGPALLTFGSGTSKKEAREMAAEQMIPQLLEVYGTFVGEDRSKNPKNVNKQNSRRVRKASKWSGMADAEWVKRMAERFPSAGHPTSMLNSWAQHKHLPVPTYEITSEEIVSVDNECEKSLNCNESQVSNDKEPNETLKSTDMNQEEDLPPSKRSKTDIPPTPRMYTVHCVFGNKKFIGKDMDIKKAKMLASAAAWEEFCPKNENK